MCRCGEILETRFYLRCVLVASVVALGLALVLVRVGWLSRFSSAEVIMMLTAILAVGYPAAKVVQKLRQPSRSILLEMGSVYTSRFDRVIIMSAIAAVVMLVSGMFTLSASELVHPDYAPIRAVWIWTSITLWDLAVLGMILDQRLAFFDLRVANVYVDRYGRQGDRD